MGLYGVSNNILCSKRLPPYPPPPRPQPARPRRPSFFLEKLSSRRRKVRRARPPEGVTSSDQRAASRHYNHSGLGIRGRSGSSLGGGRFFRRARHHNTTITMVWRSSRFGIYDGCFVRERSRISNALQIRRVPRGLQCVLNNPPDAIEDLPLPPPVWHPGRGRSPPIVFP